jgi:hypothetical protein
VQVLIELDISLITLFAEIIPRNGGFIISHSLLIFKIIVPEMRFNHSLQLSRDPQAEQNNRNGCDNVNSRRFNALYIDKDIRK